MCMFFLYYILIINTFIYSVSYKFGVISMLAGLAGVPTGTFVAQKLRYKYPRIDAHICAFGLLVSSPLIFISCVTARYSIHTCFALVFFAMFFLNLNWSLVADIVMVSIADYVFLL